VKVENKTKIRKKDRRERGNILNYYIFLRMPGTPYPFMLLTPKFNQIMSLEMFKLS